MVGAALAWAVQRELPVLPVLAALTGSMCIQMGTNLHNDAVDSELGGDGPDRIGPPRVTAMRLFSARNVKLGVVACFAASALLELYLMTAGGLADSAARRAVNRSGLGLHRRTVADRLYCLGLIPSVNPRLSRIRL